MSKGPRPISELFPAVLERCGRLQPLHLLLRTSMTAGQRKETILHFCSTGTIDAEEATLLLQVYQLETA